MTLAETLRAVGLTPPARLVEGRWMRFPGIGKGPSNRAGWCRLISPTLAIYGDWSASLSAVWHDEQHVDTARSRQLLEEARRREQQFAREQRKRQQAAALAASRALATAIPSHHPYLARKGFPEAVALVKDEKLLVPMRDVESYRDLLGVQEIDVDGGKRFLPGSRTKGAVYCLGLPGARTVLCEGYATGLTLDAALARLTGKHCVVVCFSAMNLVTVARHFPHAVVCADNDMSGTGEEAAKKTGLKWTMPYEVGTDFNDLHQAMGLYAVVERMREVFTETKTPRGSEPSGRSMNV